MHYTDTLNTDTTLDIDETQDTVSCCNNPSAHSRLRSMFGYFAERASPAGYEPTEQFEDLSSHNCASKPGDSKISSISSSSGSRQKLPRRRSQVLFHMIRRREIGRDNESMNTDGLQEKNGASMKTRSPFSKRKIPAKPLWVMRETRPGIGRVIWPISVCVPRWTSKSTVETSFGQQWFGQVRWSQCVGGVAVCVGPWSADSSDVGATVASQKRSRAFGLKSVVGLSIWEKNRCVQSQSPATAANVRKHKITHPRPQALNQNSSPVSDACLPRSPSHQ